MGSLCGGSAPASRDASCVDVRPAVRTLLADHIADPVSKVTAVEAPEIVKPVEIAELPPKPAPTTPITLQTLQGDWVNSMGAKISVSGTEVTLNGLLMKVHPVMLDEDGLVLSIGRLWQLNGWLEDEKLEFKESPSREVMQFARSVVWSKATVEKMEEWNEQMSSLGYAGSASDPLKRGVEGCCPGSSDAKARTAKDSVTQDREDLETLNRIISEWREPELMNIPPAKVIPDFSNRGQTGLSVEHVHYLAGKFKEQGFQVRQGNKGHDIPVLVRDQPSSDLGLQAIANWRSKIEDESGFAPKEHYELLFAQEEMFTSLGNGHFNQALNLFGNECKSIYSEDCYVIGSDVALRDAVHNGVEAIVLKNSIPLRDRETVSKLLNSKREYKWNVNADGSLNILGAVEDTTQVSQFEAMSKVLDAVELNCLVRAELNVKESHRIGQ